jgi:hypothetical protein
VWEILGKLNFLNIFTNTDHKELNQGNVGPKTAGNYLNFGVDFDTHNNLQ